MANRYTRIFDAGGKELASMQKIQKWEEGHLVLGLVRRASTLWFALPARPHNECKRCAWAGYRVRAGRSNQAICLLGAKRPCEWSKHVDERPTDAMETALQHKIEASGEETQGLKLEKITSEILRSCINPQKGLPRDHALSHNLLSWAVLGMLGTPNPGNTIEDQTSTQT